MATDRNKAIGQAIQKLRVAAGLSQIELAQRLNELGESFHQQTVVKVENGTRTLKLTEAMSMAEALGVSVDMFTRSPQEIDATATGQNKITSVLQAHKEVRNAAKEAQFERIELAFWLLHQSEGADTDTITASKLLLGEDLAVQCHEGVEEAMLQTFGLLPGEEPDHRMLELLGWPFEAAGDGTAKA